MKAISTKSLFIGIATFCATTAFSQTGSGNLPPGQAAKFGIDGDLRSDERQNGSFSAAGSHDWFKKTGGTGLGMIDTTGAARYKAQIRSGANVAFSQRMQFPRYSVQDGVLLMDATYARDYADNDKTSFSGNSTKNTASPTQWGTAPNGSNVSDKTDIIDTYVSMRRNGSTINSNNPSNLIATMALATLATAGDHYTDFEFYKQRIGYNATTGNFENPGPAAYGGHSLWEFNADGSIKSWGDLTISFSFNSSSVSDIKILIWVSKAAYTATDPKFFDFIPNEFYESTSVNGYGYAAIKPNGAGKIVAWGTVNSATTLAPVWGSNSKEIGSAGTNYFSDSYSAGQLAEAAVDLTSLGIDPATFSNTNACNPPFTRFMTKSRSSSSFSSSLSDFNGPYEFLDAPSIPADISDPARLTCAASSVRLQPASFITGGAYNWSTLTGAIAKTAPDQSYIDVTKAGTYYLTAALAVGCLQTLDSVVVTQDIVTPDASAGVSSPVVMPGASVILLGSAVLNSAGSPFGGSQGMTWKWDGLNGIGFTSTLQSPLTTKAGSYRLIVTELRNGCKDTAFASVGLGSLLPVKFTGLVVNADRQRKQNNLSWTVAAASDVKTFVVEKSSNGSSFSSVLEVPGTNATTYSTTDAANGASPYYRIRAVQSNGDSYLSSVVRVENAVLSDGVKAYTDGSGNIVVTCSLPQTETLTIRLPTGSGQLLQTQTRVVEAGNATLTLTPVTKPPTGLYYLRVSSAQEEKTIKLLF